MRVPESVRNALRRNNPFKHVFESSSPPRQEFIPEAPVDTADVYMAGHPDQYMPAPGHMQVPQNNYVPYDATITPPVRGTPETDQHILEREFAKAAMELAGIESDEPIGIPMQIDPEQNLYDLVSMLPPGADIRQVGPLVNDPSIEQTIGEPPIAAVLEPGMDYRDNISSSDLYLAPPEGQDYCDQQVTDTGGQFDEDQSLMMNENHQGHGLPEAHDIANDSMETESPVREEMAMAETLGPEAPSHMSGLQSLEQLVDGHEMQETGIGPYDMVGGPLMQGCPMAPGLGGPEMDQFMAEPYQDQMMLYGNPLAPPDEQPMEEMMDPRMMGMYGPMLGPMYGPMMDPPPGP